MKSAKSKIRLNILLINFKPKVLNLNLSLGLSPFVKLAPGVDFSQKIVFLPFLVAILNFCIKCKNAFISEMVQDGAISTKFFIPPGICKVLDREILMTF